MKSDKISLIILITILIAMKASDLVGGERQKFTFDNLENLAKSPIELQIKQSQL